MKNQLAQRYDGCLNLKTKKYFLYFQDISGNDVVINPFGTEIPFDEKLFGEIENISVENFSREQISVYNEIDEHEKLANDQEKEEDRSIRILLENPRAVHLIWSMAKWAAGNKILTGSDRWFLGNCAKKMTSGEVLLSCEKGRLVDTMLVLSQLGYAAV